MRNMRQCIGLFMTLFALTVAFSGSGKGQSQDKRKADNSDTKDGLQLSVELERSTVRLNETPNIVVKLKNVGTSPITIYKKLAWGRASSLTLLISAVHGKLSERAFLDDASHWPPFPREDFITIQPGESVQQERGLDLPGVGIEESGEYHVAVSYHSPVPREFAPSGLQLWATENGALHSRPIRLRVIQ